MIFGNPGVYIDGVFGGFALQIDKVCNSGFYSLNLCLNNQIYPRYLVIDKKEYISVGLHLNDEIFCQEDEYFFLLNDNELMVELIKSRFPRIYEIEVLIRDKLIDFELLEKDESLIYDLIPNDDYDYKLNFYWDLGCVEYKNIYPFIINFKGRSKVVVISSIKSDLIEEDRFFNIDGSLKKKLTFFGGEYWNISIAELPTDELRSIVKSAFDYIMES